MILVVAMLLAVTAPQPVLRDFIGLNVHTVQFKPALYQPVTRLVRDYHGFDWDVGDDTSHATTFPFARNRVDWGAMYDAWKAAGCRIDAYVMFEQAKTNAWKNLARDSYVYGRAFAEFFGKRQLVESIEIGNEPGKYPDAMYRSLLENAAAGIRAGDPQLKTVTCAMQAKPSGDYHKSVSLLPGLEKLYDVINIHSYPFAELWPTWRRSFPEDPKIDYLTDIQKLIDWRNAHAPGKEVWLTEFGYDAPTKPQGKAGVSDRQQAQYIVRSYLLFSAMDLGRAYLYWFNDDDQPTLHAASGLTRHYQPKPAFHAVAHLLATLGDYRFSRVVQKTGELYVYEYSATPQKRIWAVWSPVGSRQATLPLPPVALIEKAERMPLSTEPVPVAAQATFTVEESPTYFWLTMP